MPALRAGKPVAIANKECLVCAGSLGSLRITFESTARRACQQAILIAHERQQAFPSIDIHDVDIRILDALFTGIKYDLFAIG